MTPIIRNNTNLTLHEIENRKQIGQIKNNWRKRMVYLHHSDTAGLVYMIGRSFDGTMIVVSHEEIGMNERIAIDYWNRGQKIYVRD